MAAVDSAQISPALERFLDAPEDAPVEEDELQEPSGDLSLGDLDITSSQVSVKGGTAQAAQQTLVASFRPAQNAHSPARLQRLHSPAHLQVWRSRYSSLQTAMCCEQYWTRAATQGSMSGSTRASCGKQSRALCRTT